MNPLSRFKPLDHLPLSPGVCLICSGGVGPFIDTSRQLDFEGAVYVCLGCVSEMAAQLGLNLVLNEEEVELKVASAANEAYEAGRLEVMRLFSEFVSVNSVDRVRSLDAPVNSESDTNHVEAVSGAEANNVKPEPSDEQGDGSLSFEEFRGLSGDSSDGESLFAFGDR